LGGSHDDAIYSIDNDQNNDVYVTGGTVSSNFPVTPNAAQTAFNGGSGDGFLSHIKSDGTALLGSTYFGSSAYDQSYFVRTDKDDGVYIFGQTRATGSALMVNASYGTPNSGQFLAKFPYTLDTLSWSTVFGTGNGQPNISPTSFMVDQCKRLYVSGWGRIWGNSVYQGVFYPWGAVFGTKNMQITPDAIQSVTDGQDFYVAVFGQDASSLEYGTYFGEVHYNACGNSGRDHVDGGTSRFDPFGNIIQSVCASCGACQQFPTFPDPGVWSVNNNSSNCNNAVFKIQLKTDIALASFGFSDLGCAPDSVAFHNYGKGNSFLWTFGDPGSGSLDTSVLANPYHVFSQPGVYQVRLISYLPGGCISSDTVFKTIVIQANTLSLLDTVYTCQGIPVQIGITGNGGSVTYAWTPTQGLSNPNVPNPFANPATTTNYQCVLNNGSCVDTLLQTVEVHSLQVDAGNDGMLCAGNQLITGSSNRSGVSFLWSSSALFYDTLNNYPGDSTVIIQLVSDTNLFLKGLSLKGCEDTDQLSLFNGSTLIDAGVTDTVCLGETLQLTVQNLNPSIPVTYNWSPTEYILSGGQSSQAIVQPPFSMWFYVQALSPAFCLALDSVFVCVDSFYVALNQSNVSCNGFCDGSASIVAMGGIGSNTATWSNGSVGTVVMGLCAGDYWVQVTDSFGCDTLINFTIIEPSALSVASQLTQVLCHGSFSGAIDLTVSGGTPPYSYLWNTGASSQDLNALAAGVYSVVITDANLCQVSFQYEITEPLPFELIIDKQDVTCKGEHNGHVVLSVSGATPPYDVQWSNGDIGFMADSLPAGVVSAIITDNNNCDTTVYVPIIEPDSLWVLADVENVKCHGGTDGAIMLEVSGGTLPYSFLWSNGATSATIQGLQAGYYEVWVTDSLECVATKTMQIVQPLPLTAAALVQPVSCKGYGDGSIVLETTGGNAPYSYLWSTGDTLNTILMQSGGPYQVLVTDANQCDTAFVFIIPESTDSLWVHATVKQPSCFGTADGSIQIAVSGGAIPYQYQWSNGASTASLNGLAPGELTLLVTDAFGCIKQLDFTILSPDSLIVIGEISNASCGNNGRIDVSLQGGSPPFLYQWSNGADSSSISNLALGHYNLQIIDFMGCTAYKSFEITGAEALQAQVEVEPCRCFESEDGQILLTATGGNNPYSITWMPESYQGFHLVALPSGSYAFTLVDRLGCLLTDTVFVPQPDAMLIKRTITPAVCEGMLNGSIFIEIEGGISPYTYVWNTQATTQNLENVGKGFYTVHVMDINQCMVSDTITLPEISCELIIPNVFTPNADGVNDRFEIIGILFYPENQLLIFNRWGKEILAFTGYKNEWDGRDASGDKMADGVYFYILKLNNGRQFQGSITIMSE
jgi:gliding motility-associated-like protein